MSFKSLEGDKWAHQAFRDNIFLQLKNPLLGEHFIQIPILKKVIRQLS